MGLVRNAWIYIHIELRTRIFYATIDYIDSQFDVEIKLLTHTHSHSHAFMANTQCVTEHRVRFQCDPTIQNIKLIQLMFNHEFHNYLKTMKCATQFYFLHSFFLTFFFWMLKFSNAKFSLEIDKNWKHLRILNYNNKSIKKITF